MRRWTLTGIVTLVLFMASACGAAPNAAPQTTVAPQNATALSAQPYQVQLEIAALQTGNQVATVDVRDSSGQPVIANTVVITPLMEEMDMFSPPSTAKQIAPGRYQAPYVYFAMTGLWQVDVQVDANGQQQLTRFVYTITDSSTQ
jgi:hypothetical protein